MHSRANLLLSGDPDRTHIMRGRFIEPQVSLQGLRNFDQMGNVVLDGLVSSPADFYGASKAV